MRALIMVLVALWGTQVAAQQPNPPKSPEIATSAEAESTVPADRATILIAVETNAPTAAAAASDNARRTKATLDTLRALGLYKDQTGTVGYSVNPQYEYSQGKAPKVTGYSAHNTIKVEIRKLDDVGRVIDAALAGGANNINSLQYSATNVDSARRDALARATSQARGDAEAIARAAGGGLGPLVEITTDFQPVRIYSPAPAARMMLEQKVETPAEPGPITVNVTVHTRWQFTPR
jgi:uncharacterized protein